MQSFKTTLSIKTDLHIIAPLPLQLRQTSLSFPSAAMASCLDKDFPWGLIKAIVEHKHVMHNLREATTWSSYNRKQNLSNA